MDKTQARWIRHRQDELDTDIIDGYDTDKINGHDTR
jgi:hypothetical protein